MEAVIFEQAGDADVLKIATIPTPFPNDEQLLVKVHAAALNRADILQRKGKYPPPPGESSILGLEIAGTIEQIGQKVKGFSLGQRVFGLVGGGAYAQYCLIDAQMAIPIPQNFDFQQAAAIPEAFYTASETLFQLGQLQAGETVLIQAGTSGVGTAAIQLALSRKANVIFTSSNLEKLERVSHQWPCLGIDYKREDFVAEVRQLTQQKGVDVILDVIGDGYLNFHLQLLKPLGRLIQFALMGGAQTDIDLRPLLQKRLQIKGFMLRTQSLEEKRGVTQRFCQNLLPLFLEGKLSPVIDKVFDWKEVRAAHRYLESNQQIGKVILKIHCSEDIL